MIAICWNIRGALKPQGVTRLNHIIRSIKPNQLMLTEVHIKEANFPLFLRRIGRTWTGCIGEGNGRSGGVILLWQPSTTTVNPVRLSHDLLFAVISHNNEVPWVFTIVYASTNVLV